MFNLFKKANTKQINVNELDELIGKIDLIDIRENNEFAEGSIQTAKHIPMGDLLADPEKYLSKDKTYYILCRSGGRSSNTVTKLEAKGYDVVNVAGGVMNYQGKYRS
ncbi:rhodanese-like domain-containing protein [Clostridiales bacterium COT073_COT-073]|nr:rhodanese-like domain-containing protein [Clostridiales bacterium COT073_COT-073]